MRLGCVADDFTGATDLANNLVRAGMRVVQTIGLPLQPVPEADAVVVALKSRTAPVAQAVAESRAAAAWLREQGARQIYFKVCSTFDSTAQGNIGPVAEALLADALAAAGQPEGSAIVPVTPAFPEAGRTVFMGHLFVGEQLLSESPMRQHPLTPMTDANLVRVLQAQLRTSRAGLVTRHTVAQGAAAVAARLAALQAEGVAMAIVDAVDNADLQVLAEAAHALPLVVAGSGLAIGLPRWHGCTPNDQAAELPAPSGAAAVLSGSCSAASNAQVAQFLAAGGQAYALDPLRASTQDLAEQALAWAAPRLGEQPLLIYATAAPDAVRHVQAQLGAQAAGALVEQSLARVATGLVALGVGRMVLAGGETSGACVQALGITQLRIGAQIDPGVPWCHAQLGAGHGGHGLHLALKSGNFGRPNFFTHAFDALPAARA
jgi:3-dehydrotetronate 4-kinase